MPQIYQNHEPTLVLYIKAEFTSVYTSVYAYV